MEAIKDRGAWARFWANMGGVELADVKAVLVYIVVTDTSTDPRPRQLP